MKQLLPLSLSLSQLPYSLRTSRSMCLRLFTLSHFHTFADLTPALALPPSLLLALDSLSLAFRLPANMHYPFLSRSFYQKLLCGARQVSGAYKSVFLYFLNTYLYSYVYFFIPLWRPKLATGCNYVLHNSILQNLWQQFRKALSCHRMMMHGA